jgi:hypothetical protein
MFKKKWWRELLLLLLDNRGEEEEGGEDTDKGSEEGTDDGEDGDADADSGKKGGKDRSQYIPRERFDKVHAKAQKVDALVSLGVLEESSDGELRVSPKALKSAKDDLTPKQEKELRSLRFTKDEVDSSSWPLVEKINKSFEYYDTELAKSNFRHSATQAELAILRDYPEFIQRNSPLRTKALEIMKNDKEFKTTYRGNPQAGYWAVKRAAEALKGKAPEKPVKKKGKFIVGKGDGGEDAKRKTVNLSKLSKEELDKLEKAEFEKMKNLGRK